MYLCMAKTKENTDVSQRSPSQPQEQRLCLCVVGEGEVWVRVGSLAACLGEHCHHLQAVLVEVSQNVPFPFTCLLKVFLELEDELSYSGLTILRA